WPWRSAGWWSSSARLLVGGVVELRDVVPIVLTVGVDDRMRLGVDVLEHALRVRVLHAVDVVVQLHGQVVSLLVAAGDEVLVDLVELLEVPAQPQDRILLGPFLLFFRGAVA